MKPLYLLFILFFTLLACKQKPILPLGKTTFNIGTYANETGSFYDAKTAKEYVYFIDKKSYKNIKIFDLKGYLVKSVSLKKCLNDYGNILFTHLENFDSIFTYVFPNQLVLLNGNGDETAYFDFNGRMMDAKKNTYELVPEFSTYQKGEFVSKIEFLSNMKDELANKIPQKRIENIYWYYNKSFYAFGLASLNNLDKKKQHVQFGFPNKIRLKNKDNHENGRNRIGATENKLFYTGSYLDCFYILDRKTFKIIKKVKIEADVKFKPMRFISISESAHAKDLDNYIDIHYNIPAKSKARISDLYINNMKKCIYITLYHDFKNYKNREASMYRNFSVLKYDFNGNKLGEISFDKNKHIKSLLVLNNGIYVKRKNNLKDELKIQVYEKYDF